MISDQSDRTANDIPNSHANLNAELSSKETASGRMLTNSLHSRTPLFFTAIYKMVAATLISA